MFIKLLLISVLLLAIVALFLGLRILIKKHGSFPEIHISQNREMRKRGISCGGNLDIGCTPSNDYKECAVCSKKII